MFLGILTFMRINIIHAGAGELKYEIREIIEVAKQLEKIGVNIVWENIGDPVAKGESIPLWVKEIIKKNIDDDGSFAYSPTKGVEKTREFLAGLRNAKKGAQITKEDIIFFNGLGDAISKVYTSLNRSARVIGPSPAYSTHSSAEAAHAGSEHLTYKLDPKNGWLPDFSDLENKVKYNSSITGILIVNPDNPTGVVYNKGIMKKFVDIAKKYDLFLISDEIYANIWHNGTKPCELGDVISDVCGIAMRGISKELPWPGARCGWIEVYNKERDSIFAKYIKSILDAKMLEVCSTTLPQRIIPEIMSDKRYKEHHRKRNQLFAKRANAAHARLKDIKEIIVNRPSGAFYMTIFFKDGILNANQKLEIHSDKAKRFIEKNIKNVSLDKRFVYYLMASSGICVVPLTGFNCDLFGFRVTLLENDEEKFDWIFKTLNDKIKEYIHSA